MPATNRSKALKKQLPKQDVVKSAFCHDICTSHSMRLLIKVEFAQENDPDYAQSPKGASLRSSHEWEGSWQRSSASSMTSNSGREDKWASLFLRSNTFGEVTLKM